jgi:hypothetical protein
LILTQYCVLVEDVSDLIFEPGVENREEEMEKSMCFRETSTLKFTKKKLFMFIMWMEDLNPSGSSGLGRKMVKGSSVNWVTPYSYRQMVVTYVWDLKEYVSGVEERHVGPCLPVPQGGIFELGVETSVSESDG